MKHLLIDLDDCLVDTSALRVYRKTPSGRKFATENIGRLPTRLADKRLVDLVKKYHNQKKATIVTNSPKDYAVAVLKKHGFPDVPVIGAAKKPWFGSLENLVGDNGKDFVMIGDSPKDVLPAHLLNVVSIGTTWYQELTPDYLAMSEPTKTVKSVDDLLSILEDVESGKINWVPFKLPKEFEYLPDKEFKKPIPNIEWASVGDYIPYSEGGDEFSSDILNYKNIKEIWPTDINRAIIQFFSTKQQRIMGWKRYSSALVYFAREVAKIITEAELEGSTLLVPAPNSNPKYCYKSFPNEMLALEVSHILNDKKLYDPEKRVIYRTLPKPKASETNNRNRDFNLWSLGVEPKFSSNPDNVVILDDVRTSGSQIECVAKVLNYFGIGKNYYAVVLGQTVNDKSY
jgi:hypothetical protein